MILLVWQVFWLIPPTHDNVERYVNWVLSAKQGDYFLADHMDQCQMLRLKAGYTFIIPSGQSGYIYFIHPFRSVWLHLHHPFRSAWLHFHHPLRSVWLLTLTSSPQFSLSPPPKVGLVTSSSSPQISLVTSSSSL